MGERTALAAVLGRYLDERGYRVDRLARDACVPKQSLSRWLSGATKRPHHWLPLLQVAAALELPRARADHLLRAAGQPPLAALLARAHPPAEAALLDRWRAAGPHTLPAALNAFFGREDEVFDLADTLADPAVRLLTLTGPGGGGKTRLALRVAEALLDQFPDGVWFVPLAAVADPAQVLPAIAAALDLGDAPGVPVAARLAARLRDRRALLLLDNFEQVADAGPDLTALLAAAPGPAALVTSRVPLRVTGEHERPVAPLPPPGPTDDPAALRANPAAALFAARAHAANPAFALDRATAPAVAELCARLDGLPLAIELAAARVRDFPPAALLAHFPGRLDLAADGPRDAPTRQRTLRTAIGWSHDLLPSEHQVLFARLAAFAGGATPDAVAAICDPGDGRAGDVARGLEALREGSLLSRAADPDGAPRYAMLPTIREFALERLAECGEGETVHRRHLEWCVVLAEAGGSHLAGGAQREAHLRRLDAERDNLRAALAWARDADPPAGLRLAAAAWPHWLVRHRQAEGRTWLRALLARTPARDLALARALHGLGYLELWHDVPAARAALEEALALAVELGAAPLAAELRPALAYAYLTSGALDAAERCLAGGGPAVPGGAPPGLRGLYRMLRGYLALERGRPDEAHGALADALAAFAAAGLPLFRCMALARLGEAELKRGDLDGARAAFADLGAAAAALGAPFYAILAEYRLGMVQERAGALDAAGAAYERCLALAARAGGDRLARAASLLGLGRIALRQGDGAGATARLREAADLAAPLQDRRLWREVAYWLGVALWRVGRRAEAAGRLSEALELRAGGDPAALARSLEALAALAADEGDGAAAARWLAAAARHDRAGAPRPPEEERRARATLERARASLDSAALAAAEAAGRGLSAEAAAADAAAWLRARATEARGDQAATAASEAARPAAAASRATARASAASRGSR